MTEALDSWITDVPGAQGHGMGDGSPGTQGPRATDLRLGTPRDASGLQTADPTGRFPGPRERDPLVGSGGAFGSPPGGIVRLGWGSGSPCPLSRGNSFRG